VVLVVNLKLMLRTKMVDRISTTMIRKLGSYGKKAITADYKHSRQQWRMNIRNNDKAVSKWQDKTNKQDWRYQPKDSEA
jgi:hypothetical protein